MATTFTLPVPPKVELANPSSALAASEVPSVVPPASLPVGLAASDSGRAAARPLVVSPTFVGPAFVRSSGVTLTCSTIPARNHDVALRPGDNEENFKVREFDEKTIDFSDLNHQDEALFRRRPAKATERGLYSIPSWAVGHLEPHYSSYRGIDLKAPSVGIFWAPRAIQPHASASMNGRDAFFLLWCLVQRGGGASGLACDPLPRTYSSPRTEIYTGKPAKNL